MRKKYYIITTILFAVIIIYFIPVKKQKFKDLYTGDENIENSLYNFRKYATKSLAYSSVNWEYLSTGEGVNNILFIHGMGGAYDIWWQQINRLKSDFKIISVTVPAVHSLETVTKGIREILQKEKIEKINIVGTSMGGYIAQYFLKKYPEILKKVILGNTFPPNKIFKKKNGTLRKLIPFLPEWLIMNQFRANIFTKVSPASENSKLVEAYLLEQYSGLMSKQQLIGRYDIVVDRFAIDKTPVHKNVPKLIIQSNNDPLINSALRNDLRSGYPEAEIFTFIDKGHFPYLNQANIYTQVIRDFLIK